MKSVMATLTVAVLVGVQPLSGQIGQQVDAPSGEVALRTQERQHVVRRGDTLWDLAGHYYDNPYTWPTIHDANPAVVEDPHWIYPNEVLVIPGLPTAIAEGPPGAAGEITPIARPAPVASRRTRFYRENNATGIVGADDRARPSVQPGEYYAAPWLADPDRMPVIGVVTRSTDAAPGGSERDLLVHPFDDVYVEFRGTTRPGPGTRLMVVDVAREFDDGADLFVIRPAGILTVRATTDDVMTATVTEHWAPFARYARVVPLDPFPGAEIPAAPVSDGPIGTITGWATESSLYGDTDYGFVDLDASQVGIGDVLMAYRVPRSGDTVLPAEPVAFMKIVRVGPVGATFRVIQVMQRRLDTGLPAQVVSRVP